MLATTIHKSNTTPHHQSRATTNTFHPQATPGTQGRHPPPTRRARGLVVSKPNSVSSSQKPQHPVKASRLFVAHQTRLHYREQAIHRIAQKQHPARCGPLLSLVVLLRKEVIQPHLPVRLPCYDFVPIADPTFDGSLPQGVRPPASGVTDFHDVTGGVYKARERIHRSVADLRLLATPTSRGRVADPDPN
jgi:hypothetical protein